MTADFDKKPLFDKNNNLVQLVDVERLPTKKLGASPSFDSPAIQKEFEVFFYRIFTQSVRACLLLCLFLYCVLYYLVIPAEHPELVAAFGPAFYTNLAF